MGPMGRGGARRRTRRRWKRASAAMLSQQQAAQVQQETGKSADQMSEQELIDALEKLGIEPPQGQAEGE